MQVELNIPRKIEEAWFEMIISQETGIYCILSYHKFKREKALELNVCADLRCVVFSDGNRPKILARALGHNGRASFQSA